MPRGIKRFAGVREPLESQQLDRAQGVALEAGRTLNRCPFLLGVPKRIKFVANVTRTIAHRLGVPAGFFMIDGNDDGTAANPKLARAGTSLQAVLDPKNQLAIFADVNCTVTLWFYPKLSLQVE